MSSSPSAPAVIPSSTSSVPIDLTPIQLEQYINRKGGIDRLSRIVLDRLSTTPDARTANVLASTRHMLAHAPPNADKPSLMKALSFILKPIETSTRQDVSQIIPNSLHSAPDWLRHAFQNEYDKALCAHRAEQSRNASLSSPANAPSPVPDAPPSSRGPFPIFPIQSVASHQSKRQKVSTTKPQSRTPLVPHPTCPSKQLAKPPIKPSCRQKPAASGDCKPKTSVLRGSVRRANTKPSNSSKSRPAQVHSSQTASAVADEPMNDQPPQKDHSLRILSHPALGQKQELAASSEIPDAVLALTTTVPESNVKQSKPVSNILPVSSESPEQPPPSADVLEAPLGTTVRPAHESERPESLQSHASPHQSSTDVERSSSKPPAKPVSILPQSVPVASDLPHSVPASLQQPNSKSRHPAVHKPTRPVVTIGKRSSRKNSPKKSLPADPLLQGTNVFVDSTLEKPCLTSSDRIGLKNHSVTKGKEQHEHTSPTSENKGQKFAPSKNVRQSKAAKDRHAVRSLPCREMPNSSFPDFQHSVAIKQSGLESKNSGTPKSTNCNACPRKEVDTTTEMMPSSDAEKSHQVVGVNKDAQVKHTKPRIARPYPTSAPSKTCNVRRTSRFGDLVREPATDDNKREKTKHGIEVELPPTSGKTTSANRGEMEVEESRSCSGADSNEGNCSEAVDDKTGNPFLGALWNDVESEHSEKQPKQTECKQQESGVDRADILSTKLAMGTLLSARTVTDPLHGERKDKGQPIHSSGSVPRLGNDKDVLRKRITSEIEHLESDTMAETPANRVTDTLRRGSTTTKKINEQHMLDVQEDPACQNLSTTGLRIDTEEVEVSLGEERTETPVASALVQLENIGSGENDFRSLAETSKSGLPDQTERAEKDGFKTPSSTRLQPHSTKSSKADETSMATKLNDGGMLTGPKRDRITCAGLGTNDSKNAERVEKRVHQQTPPLKEEHVLPSVMESSSASSEPFKSGNRKRRRASIAKVPRREAGPSQTVGQKIEQKSSKKPRTGSEHLKAGESKKRKARTGSLEMLSQAAANFAEVPAETGSQLHGRSGGGDSAIEGAVVDSNSVIEEVGVKPEDFECQQKILVALREVMEREHAVPFLQPVDLEGDFGARYCSIVKQPMDLGTIEKRLSESSEFRGFYRNVTQVFADLDLVWENCRKFNGMYDDITLAANKCADDLGMLFVKLGVEMPKGHVSRRRTALLRRPASSNRSSQPIVKPESKPDSRKRKHAEEDEDLREIIAATTPCLGDNDGRLRNKEIAVFTTLEGRVKTWYRVRVNAYDTQTKSYSLTWIDEKVQTIGATFGLGMRYPVYRA